MSAQPSLSLGKSFTQLEYERAYQHNKEPLIYLADEQVACFPYADIDTDQQDRERLAAFKSILRERHTCGSFSTPEDLAEKLKSDLKKRFPPLVKRADTLKPEFESTLALVRRFRLLPKTVVGREIKLEIRPVSDAFPASRALCKAFNLEYGHTIGAEIRIAKPKHKDMSGFQEVYATGLRVDKLLPLVEARKPVEIYARLEFTPDDVRNVRGEFFGYAGLYDEHDYEDYSDSRYYSVEPEGKVLLLFSKAAL